MPVRVFSQEEKGAIRNKLLEVGFPMLREHGLVHMSVPRIAGAAGIGTGTFYKFFTSKEQYIYELIKYRREILLREIITDDIKNGKSKLGRAEVRRMICLLVDPEKSVYANLSLKDEARIFEKVEALSPDLEHESRMATSMISFVDNPRYDIDFAVLANMMKVLVIASQAREELHKEGYDRTIDNIIDNILGLIFE